MSDTVDIYLKQGAAYKGILEGDDAATRAVNGIFASLRDRRYLKWLFHDGVVQQIDSENTSIDLDVQRAMAEEWREMIRRTHHPETTLERDKPA